MPLRALRRDDWDWCKGNKGMIGNLHLHGNLFVTKQTPLLWTPKQAVDSSAESTRRYVPVLQCQVHNRAGQAGDSKKVAAEAETAEQMTDWLNCRSSKTLAW